MVNCGVLNNNICDQLLYKDQQKIAFTPIKLEVSNYKLT